ncbi:MAG: SDR family NAD(P)-dependent oxidoreductase [Solirubrobacteraceae bacterium]
MITGAARGIGEAAARSLAAAGARLALIDIDSERIERLADELGAIAAVCDVADEERTRASVEHFAARLGGLDIVVANAGINVTATADAIAPSDFRRVVEVDLFGVWHTLRPAIPHVTQSGGYLLVVSSLGALLHLPTFGAYGAAKAGTHALANVLRVELRARGVAVGCAYFGIVDTEMLSDVRSQRSRAQLHLDHWLPVGRPITARDAGQAVLTAIESRARWLVLPQSCYPLVAISSGAQLLLEQIQPAVRERRIAAARAHPGTVRQAPHAGRGGRVSLSERQRH